MVCSEITIGGKNTSAFRYYIISLKNDPVLFQNSVREHWTIETSCHWILYFAFRGDESRARNAHAAENFSILTPLHLIF
jgi:predicted transposase YbfD/YdcC